MPPLAAAGTLTQHQHTGLFPSSPLKTLLHYPTAPLKPQGMKKMIYSYNYTRLLVFITFLAILGPVCHGGKILVVPSDGSHWVNMEIIIQALHKQGHTVDVIRPNMTLYIKEKSAHYNSITIPVTEGLDKNFMKGNFSGMLDLVSGKVSTLQFINALFDFSYFVKKVMNMVAHMTTVMFEDQDMMKMLKEKQYDLMLTDPVWGAGVLIAHYLQLPVVYNVRWTARGEGHFAIAPSPLSYIPLVGSGLTDRMTFIQRVKNVFYYMMNDVVYTFLIKPPYQAICYKYFGPDVDFFTLLQSADIWLMRVDYVFEYPRPTMPNVIYIGGFHCKPAKPLPQDLEDFVQSSGEHGVIIMSMGGYIPELPSEIAEEVAAAFAQLPQKVIWRHTGERPSTLGNNTLLVDWMPQNDLLGHPKTRAFVAHGGTNGIQEALYHSIPVVGLPVFHDQYDNLFRLRDKGGAKVLSIGTIDRNVFLESLQDVLNNPAFKENMQRLSSLHRDTPKKPLDSAIFWIEFVMRHKGAAHLRSESYRMPWYTYHSVDVIAFLLFAACLVFGMIFTIMRCMFRMFFKRKPKLD